MAKNPIIEIDVNGKLKKSYSLKGKTGVTITGTFGDKITDVSVSGSTMMITLNDKKLKLTNISNPNEIALISDVAPETMQGFYNYYYEKSWIPTSAKTKKVNGSVFDDNIELDEYFNEKGKGLTVNGGAGNDEILGTNYVDTINGGGDNDTITGGLGNDKLTGGKGKDTFVYASYYHVDTITDADVDDSILMDDVDSENLRYAKNGKNLEIYCDDSYDVNNKLVIKNYFKTKEAKRVDTLVADDKSIKISDAIKDNLAISGSGKINGDDTDNTIVGSIKADTIKAKGGDDYIVTAAGNDKVYAGKGDNTIVFKRGDGTDTVYSDGGNDTLVFDNIDSEDITVLEDGKNLYIQYSANDSVVLDKYMTTENHSVQTIIVDDYEQSMAEFLADHDIYRGGSGKIDGTENADLIKGSAKADTINAKGGDDVIFASKGNDKINGGDGNDRYVYDGFTKYEYNGVPNLGHDTIYNSNGTDTISIMGINEDYERANYFEPNIIHETSRVFPSYVDNQFYGRPHWYKKGNDLVLSAYGLYDESNGKYDDNGINTITLKDYFKAGKDGFGVKYMDNGEYKYVESNNIGDWNEQGEWVGEIVKNEKYEAINILDNAALMFDGNVTPNLISWLKPNNFTGTFMNDIIRGNSKPDTLKGGDGNDIIYGQFANDYKGTTKDKLYGDAGNDILFASDAEAFGGSGNDIFVSDHLDGSDIISDESGYDRLSLRNRQYLTYFDVEQENGQVKSTGDIYFKDISGNIDAIREVSKTNKVIRLDDDGYPAIDPYSGNVVYDWVAEKVDAVVARYVGRPAFEVSDAYLAQVAEDPTILEKFTDYGDGENYNKRYIDGWNLANYEAKEGYSLIFADWDFFVKDYDYDYHGTDVDALENYANTERDEYPANYTYQSDADYVAEHHNLIGTKEQEGSFDKSAYGLNQEHYELTGIRAILTDQENGVVIKNGTTEATAIETVSLDRGAVDTSQMGVDPKIDNIKLGDYSQEKVDDIAGKVAGWLQDNNFKSVQEVIKNGTNEQISDMLALFKGVYVWTDDVKYRKGSYAEADSEYGGTIVGTAILEDNDILGPVYDSTYALSFTHEDRASMLSDYSGEDNIILDYDEDGYSFLFDVEVDEKGNLLNYSRDFYIKFAGEEGENTGVVISYGRETRHAIETISMKDSEGENHYTLFEYDQDMIDEVRQNVAGWLTDNGYASVQDVLHSNDAEDIQAMVEVFDVMWKVE